MARNPLTAVPATRSSLPLLKIRRRLVLGVLGLSVASGVFSTCAWLTADHTPPAPPALPDQTAVSLAQTVAADFLAARKSAVPAVENVSNDFAEAGATNPTGSTPLDVTALTFTGSAPFVLGTPADGFLDTEQETFNATIDGRLYTVTVPMVKAGQRWLLGAAPSVAPAHVAGNGTHTGIDYSRLYLTNGAGDASLLPAPGYTTQINTWATTFAAAHHADHALYVLTGDTGNRTYSGLGGWSVVGNPEISSVVKVSTPRPGFIVRVALVLRPAGANGPTLNTDYDLYLASDRGDQAPPVVAWGPAGSYRSLQPYVTNAD